jgi:hypothetical protein
MKSSIGSICGGLLLTIGLISCTNQGGGNIASLDSVKDLNVCNGVSCSLKPLTDKAYVTTILLALGDEANQQLVINGGSSQLIGETVVRYSSPEENPKILLVRDLHFNGEDPEDTLYIKDVILQRYQVTYMEEPATGLTADMLQDYDVIWFNNPGHRMSSKATHDALMQFEGAVILQGDDLAQGSGFDMEDLTGLHFMDNGVNVVCSDGNTYYHDNNNGEQYRVTMNPDQFPRVSSDTIAFRYGNDIDLTRVASDSVEIMATAQGGPEVCLDDQPAIVRRLK